MIFGFDGRDNAATERIDHHHRERESEAVHLFCNFTSKYIRFDCNYIILLQVMGYKNSIHDLLSKGGNVFAIRLVATRIVSYRAGSDRCHRWSCTLATAFVEKHRYRFEARRGTDFRSFQDNRSTSQHKARSRIRMNAIRVGRYSFRVPFWFAFAFVFLSFTHIRRGIVSLFIVFHYTTLQAMSADSCRNNHSQRPSRCNPCTTSGMESCSRHLRVSRAMVVRLLMHLWMHLWSCLLMHCSICQRSRSSNVYQS